MYHNVRGILFYRGINIRYILQKNVPNPKQMSVFARTHESRFLMIRHNFRPIRHMCLLIIKRLFLIVQIFFSTIQIHSILSKIGNKLVTHSTTRNLKILEIDK